MACGPRARLSPAAAHVLPATACVGAPAPQRPSTAPPSGRRASVRPPARGAPPGHAPPGHAPPGHAHSHRRPRAPWNPPRMSMRTEGGRRPEAPGGPLTRKRPAGAARASPSGDAGPGRHGLSHGAALAAKPPHRPLLAGPGGAEARAGESAARAPRPLRPAAPGVRGPRRQPSFPLS